MRQHTQQSAFTLVELSIVLVILGLLIGGVLTGQTLIRAAELRNVATQQARYVTAVQTFRDKYFALPGDMTNATAYWGAADGSTGLTAACYTTVGTGTATCNGNGDGLIGGAYDRYRFWQHLANAGLIEGSYTGVPNSGTTYGGEAKNTPASKISSAYWWAYYRGPTASNNMFFNGDYGNTFELGIYAANGEPTVPFIKPEEAFNIDTKIDDGKPGTGKVTQFASIFGTATSCTDGTSYATTGANYLLQNGTIACALVFAQAF